MLLLAALAGLSLAAGVEEYRLHKSNEYSEHLAFELRQCEMKLDAAKGVD